MNNSTTTESKNMEEVRPIDFQKDYKGCMTLEEYQKELKNHDWYYNYSDDHRVYSAGSYNTERLYYIAMDNGWNNILEEYRQRYKV